MAATRKPVSADLPRMKAVFAQKTAKMPVVTKTVQP
jgi:hypothetical protein